MYTDNYVIKSLELHLFFARIMKEHALFLKAGFTPAGTDFSDKAEYYKKQFEKVLSCAVNLSDGIVSQSIIESGEIVTEFTSRAEEQTQAFTCIHINRSITEKELKLRPGCPRNIGNEMCSQVYQLNRFVIGLLNGFIDFKEQILKNVLCCKLFTMNYPLLIEHILREAKLYRQYVEILEGKCDLTDNLIHDIECFWNQIMMEHALFIRGLLDPAESELINTANDFAGEYSALLSACNQTQDQTLTMNSLEETIRFRDFKKAGTIGIEECKIRSIILPLLADHVLREANHFIRILK
ncbi:MAG: DUF2935 domain-containing protein [Anaerovoracaceae bacterium]